MIIDSITLFLLGFNFTYLDIDRSRSFGIATEREDWVEEAEKLFMADATRQQYTPECDSFIVSPGNSRPQLLALLESARHQILIYDEKLSDLDVMRVLVRKVRAGLDVRIIGSAGKRAIGVRTKRHFMRLHAQIIICDGERMFLGSQSLRTLELDARREVGVVTDNQEIVQPVLKTFEADWEKVNGTLTDWSLSSLSTLTLDDVGPQDPPSLSPAVTAELVKAAVKEAIKDAILERVEPLGYRLPLKEAVKEAAREALNELAG